MRQGIFNKAFLALPLLAAVLVCPAFGANLLVEGGDFEAGMDGFGVTPVLLVQNWPSFVPPAIDSTTAGQGSKSLKLTNGSGQDVFEIRSRAFHIDHPRGDVSLSFYAKSDTPGARIDSSICSGPLAIATHSFELSDQWKRYEFTITPKHWTGGSDSNRSPIEGVYYLRLTTPSVKPWKTIWLDGIQIELGPVTDYAAPKPVSLGFSIDRRIAVYHPDEIPQITLHAAGNGIAGQTVKVQIEELVSGVKQPPIELTLAADGDSNHGQVAIPLTSEPRGCYRITATTADGKTTQSRGYGVIESLGNRPRSQRAFFGGSIETFQGARYFTAEGIPTDSNGSLVCSHYSPDETFALAHDLGWAWWHAYWPYSPYILNPTGDKFNWTDAEILADLARKHDLEILANLCAHGSSRQLPDWMKGDQISLGGMAMGKGDHLVDPSKYTAYAKTVVEHFKDKIHLWEPWNEPGVKMRATEYVPLLRAAYTGIKAADPNATVYGLCGTWDVDGDLYGWVRSCLHAGAADCMDKISIHGYHVIERRYAAKVKEMAREISGRDWVVADTEAGPYVTFQVYPQLTDAMFGEPLADLDDTIGSMPRLYINELANGVERGSWFNLVSYYAGIHYRDLVMLEYDGAPTPAMIAYNTLVDLLGPSKHYASVPMGGDVAIEVFLDINGHPLVSLWADKDPQTLQIPVASSQMELVDLLGRALPAPAKGEGIEMKLTRRPVFLRTNSMSADQVVAALGKSVVEGLDEVEITRAGLSRDGEGKPALAIALHGKKAPPSGGVLSIANSPWPLTTTSQAFPPVQLDGSEIVYFPLQKDPTVATDAKLNLGVKLDDSWTVSHESPLKIWSSPKASAPVTVDGDLSEWDRSEFRQVSDWVSAAGKWDDKGIYFAFRVLDSTQEPQIPRAMPWKSDSIELYFNPSIEQSFQNSDFSPGDAQIICSAPGVHDSSAAVFTAYRGQQFGTDLNKSPRMDPKNIMLATRRFDGGYTMEIFVPWSNFPENFRGGAGNFIGFSMAIRDVDESGIERRRVIWAGDETDYRTTNGYGVLVFTP